MSSSNINYISLKEMIDKANTGADAIKRAPIVEENTGVRCLRIGDVSNDRPFEEWGFTNADMSVISKFELKRDDILVARTGNTIGVVRYIKDDLKSVYNNGLIRLKVASSYHPKYIYYNLISEQFKSFIYGISAGTSTQPNMKIDHMLQYPIMNLGIQEQKAIANILTSLDDKIELNNQMNKTLEEMAQALFKRWFVDFEFPNEDGEPYKSSGGEMVDSELGMIPKGWEIKSLDEIADFLNGLAMQKFRADEGEDSLPVLKIKELKQGKTDSSSDRCSKNIQDKYIIDDGDVIFSWSGSLAVGIWCGGIAGLNQHLFKVTSTTYPKWFYYMWLNEHLERFIRIAADKATTMGHIKRQHLSESKVLVPSMNLLEKMHSQFDCLVNKGVELKIEAATLESIRNTLLPKLMSGEIRVEE